MKLFYVDCDNEKVFMEISFYKHKKHAWDFIKRNLKKYDLKVNKIVTNDITFRFITSKTITKRWFKTEGREELTIYAQLEHADHASFCDKHYSEMIYRTTYYPCFSNWIEKINDNETIQQIDTNIGTFTIKELSIGDEKPVSKKNKK